MKISSFIRFKLTITVLFLLLIILVSPSILAELYKCTSAAETVYQDKPCQITQSQAIIAQKPDTTRHEPVPVTVLPASTLNNGTLIIRDALGKIKRSEKAKNDFKAANPCPGNGKHAGSCPGYVIDHINPLACGGVDDPSNMQWQTVTAGKEKDGWERDNCQSSTKLSTPAVVPDSYPTNNDSQIIYVGSRGGRYVLTAKGKKRYLGHKR